MARRRGNATSPVKSRDTYVLHMTGSASGTKVSKHPHAQLALLEAQSLAQHATAPIVITVIRRPLLGGAEHPVYRVERDDHRVILTHTLGED